MWGDPPVLLGTVCPWCVVCGVWCVKGLTPPEGDVVDYRWWCESGNLVGIGRMVGRSLGLVQWLIKANTAMVTTMNKKNTMVISLSVRLGMGNPC